MGQKRLRPATVISGHGPREIDHAWQAINPENATSPLDIQARRIADRFRVPIDMARAVAGLAFGEVRA